ncbi:MAG: tRNA preQ1(34) S-adenosylmethionine ribosyltransferase-isomerase QueA [Actinobacteria bacterium]|nr:tRNA preQ1(34) S-adenosylmethionine ribosyltransferase-isomerase QueA [Actinomycetota bacterium]
MRLSSFDYELPQELIAQEPVEPRDSSRLMVLHRDAKLIESRRFREIIGYFEPGDCLVANMTRVIPARIYGTKEGTGAKVEVLLLEQKDGNRWEALVRPGKRVPVGSRINFIETLSASVVAVAADGRRLLDFYYEGDFEELLRESGEMPLPPYIKQPLKDPERYQTVYGVEEGSVAAPTAGLHFTGDLMERIRSMGVHVAFVTLDVGLDTFRPVTEEEIEKHVMHSERYRVDDSTARMVNEAKKRGDRVIAVGTTTTRALESAADGEYLLPSEGRTEVFINPGYRFKIVDALITNFHLPKSTLLMMVAAFAGLDFTMEAYRRAIEDRYRFYSFGDAMLIV